MTNTALSAGVENTQKRNEEKHMVFANEEHEKFYFEKLAQARYQDCEHKALIYVLGISGDTRSHFDRIYDIRAGLVNIKCLQEGWQTSGSLRIVRLAFNLYTNWTPSIANYKKKDEQIAECKEYSISDIFCCSYALYFWEGIKIRYPEYCAPQKSIEEIIEGLRRKKIAKSKNDGDKE